MSVHAPSLSGWGIGLDPMRPEDAEGLLEAAGSPETFRWFTKPPREWTVGGMGAYCDLLLETPSIRPYTVRVGGEIVGSTTFCDIHPQHRSVEVGWTWYAPACRGTVVNPACKLLLLSHAFGGGLFGEPAYRVCLKTDARNERSRRAILKLGASFEGVLRSHVVMPDGFRRDSAVYSVMVEEWPAVERGLRARAEAGSMKA